MASTHFGHFKPDSAGIMEIFKSQAMQSALQGVANAKASEATSIGHLHRTNKQPHYKGVVKVLDRTAVGVVKPADKYAVIDNKAHHTIDAINH
ncbi:hypothetical protein ACUYFE_07935 [Olegusella massiliensis]|uniref:hypothetical protein n=1 Tax=Olegusella massiliensis TaxID=1776381 RepID=UPI0040556984